MKSSLKTPRYTANDLRSAAASLALEGLVVTAEDTQEALAVLNGELSWDDYVQALRVTVSRPR